MMNDLQIIECNKISKLSKQEMIRWSFLEMIVQAPNHGQIMLANFLLCIHREQFGESMNDANDNPFF
jgi:hypothetical protein